MTCSRLRRHAHLHINLSGVIGRSRTRLPVAWKTAFATAAGAPTIPISPMPRDEEGKIVTVRYQAVNAMLLNEFLKEHRTVQELGSTVAKEEATIAN
jgi:hypothetical protein